MERLTFADLIDINSLQMMQDSFSAYTGLAMCVVDTKGEPFVRASGCTDFCDKYTKCSEKGLSRCDECDVSAAKKALAEGHSVIYTCHAGLTDFVIPIIFDGRIIGSIIAGQVRSDDFSEAKAREVALDLGIDPDEYIAAADKTRYVPKEQTTRLAKFLSDFSNALTVMAHENYKKLAEMKKMEKTARSQSTFITGLTDDLRVSMKDWIGRLEDAAEKYKDIPEIKAETEELIFKAVELYSEIDGAVDYIRMSGGSAEYSESVYNVRGLVDKCAKTLEKQAEAQGVKIETRFDETVPETLVGNSGRIGQVVTKLGASLVNFTGADGVVIIEASCEKTDYSCVLTIRVRGEGTRMTQKAAIAISGVIQSGGRELFGDMGILTPKDANFSLIVLLLKQMSGVIDAESLADRNVVFRVAVP